MSQIYKVLITDDNQNLCEIIGTALDKIKIFDVVGIANDGLSSLDMIEELEPDLLILDIIMPHLDGLGVIERINDMNLKKRPKIVVLSGIGQDDITFRAMSTGADYYMIKPFDMKEFVKRLTQFITSTGIDADKKHIPLDIHIEIDKVFKDLGLPTHTKGFCYLKEAMHLVFEDISVLNKVTTFLYPAISGKYETTPSRVERAIRNTIKITLERGEEGYINTVFGASMNEKKSKITNSEFISVLANLIRERT